MGADNKELYKFLCLSVFIRQGLMYSRLALTQTNLLPFPKSWDYIRASPWPVYNDGLEPRISCMLG